MRQTSNRGTSRLFRVCDPCAHSPATEIPPEPSGSRYGGGDPADASLPRAHDFRPRWARRGRAKQVGPDATALQQSWYVEARRFEPPTELRRKLGISKPLRYLHHARDDCRIVQRRVTVRRVLESEVRVHVDFVCEPQEEKLMVQAARGHNRRVE